MPPCSPLMVSVPGSLPFRCSITHTGGAGPRCPRSPGHSGRPAALVSLARRRRHGRGSRTQVSTDNLIFVWADGFSPCWRTADFQVDGRWISGCGTGLGADVDVG